MTNERGLEIQRDRQEATRAQATSHRARWTQDERRTLQELLDRNNGHVTSEEALEMASVFGRTYGAIIVKLSELREERRLQEENNRQWKAIRHHFTADRPQHNNGGSVPNDAA